MTENDATTAESDETAHGRRDLLGKAAIAAAVTTAVGLGLACQASAANGDTVIIGANSGSVVTAFTGGTSLRVTNGAITEAAKQASIIGVQDVDNRVGVMGNATGTSGGWGVFGRNSSSSGRGVYGLNTGSAGIGVYGEHINASTGGTGVRGKSNGAGGIGVDGDGTAADLRASGSGRVIISAAGLANPPTAGSIGTIARDAAGNMWVAVATNTWRKIAGPTTAGAFHAITPMRVYDSRVAAPTPGSLVSGNNRLVSVKDGRDLASGLVSFANLVPAGATAIACNLTVSDTTTTGFLAVNPGGVTEVSASAINWFAGGQTLANGIIATISAAREVTVIAGGGGSAHFIIDVNGYFL